MWHVSGIRAAVSSKARNEPSAKFYNREEDGRDKDIK